MNNVSLTGNLVNDIVLRTTDNGVKVTSNTIAVKRNKKESNGEYGTDFINFVAWRNQAEYLSTYAKKGDRLELVGEWHTREYEDSKGKRIINELIVDSVGVHSKQKEDKPEPEKASYKEVMSPFQRNDQLPY